MNKCAIDAQNKSKTALLSINNLTHWFEDEEKPILKDISLIINRNESTALTGRSGSGKTTLLHLISGLKSPKSGRVKLEGNIFPDSVEGRKNIFVSLLKLGIVIGV